MIYFTFHFDNCCNNKLYSMNNTGMEYSLGLTGSIQSEKLGVTTTVKEQV